MSHFELAYQAAKSRDPKKISLLRLDRSFLYERKALALTPAGLCAKEGDLDSACWLMTTFNEPVNSIIYGAILGGHIKSFYSSIHSLSEPLKIILSRYKNDCKSEMLKAFAEIGELNLLSQYLKDKETVLLEEITAAILGAAYGNQVAIINYLLEHFYANHNELLISALQGAAWAGNKELLLKLLDEYNRNKNTPYREIECNAKWMIMRGCGSGGQLELLTFLRSHYTNINKSDLYSAFKSAAFYSNDDNFILTLVKQEPQLIEEAQCAMAAMQHIALLEKLLTKETNFSEIANFAKGRITSERDLFIYLSEFTKREFVQKLCKELVIRKEIDEKIIKNIPTIELNALKVIDLKNRYGLATAQGQFLYEQPKILELIVTKQYDNEALYHLVKEQTCLNYWQFIDMVKRVQKNQIKSQLIDDLEGYLNTKTSWWYNHRARCESFLDELKETRSHKLCRDLVGKQFRLFADNQAAPIQVDTDQSKHHLSAVKQKAVKDEYYLALQKFHESN